MQADLIQGSRQSNGEYWLELDRPISIRESQIIALRLYKELNENSLLNTLGNTAEVYYDEFCDVSAKFLKDVKNVIEMLDFVDVCHGVDNEIRVNTSIDQDMINQFSFQWSALAGQFSDFSTSVNDQGKIEVKVVYTPPLIEETILMPIRLDYVANNGVSDKKTFFVNILPSKECVKKGIFIDVLRESDWFYHYIKTVVEENIMRGYSSTGKFEPAQPMNRVEFLKTVLKSGFGTDDSLWEWGGKVAEPTTMTFSDVNRDDWFTPYVEFGVAEGIVQGYKPGEKCENSDCVSSEGNLCFCPADPVNRAEAVKILTKCITHDESTLTITNPSISKIKELFGNGKTDEEILTWIEEGLTDDDEYNDVFTFQDVPPNAWYFPYVSVSTMQLGDTQIIRGYRDGTQCGECVSSEDNPCFCPDKSINRAEVAKIVCQAAFGEVICKEKDEN